MRRTVIQISLFIVVVLAGYLGLFQREFVKGWFGKMTRQAKGYSPAATPRDALDKFREAVKDRDYETAATYCGGDYAELMRKSAKAAASLGTAIDDVKYNMEKNGVKSDKARLALLLLEPFPTDFKITQVKEQGEDRAYATIVEETGAPLKLDGRYENWNIDPLMCRSLAKGIPQLVELRREGQGDQKYWKIYFPVSPALNLSVDQLREKYQNYVRGLNKIKYEVVNDPVTKSDVEARLRTELEEAK
jgi:hypothetical protein